MIARRAALALLAAGCAAPPPVRLAGHGADDGGIGGTGILAATPPHGTDDGGIGGTGILGVVADAGPLRIVNGLAVRGLDADILPGDTIVAIATRDGDLLVATRASVFVAAAGPLLLATGGFSVLGTRIRVAPDTPVREADGSPGRIAAGRGYAVSGLWRNGMIMATSLRRLPAPTPLVTLRGPVRPAPGGDLQIGGTRLDPRGLSGALAPDTYAEAIGRPGPAGLRVEQLTVGLPPPLAGRRPLAVEGFVSPNDSAPGFHLSGFGLPLDPSSRIGAAPGPRRVFLGRLGADGFRIAEAVALPDDPAGRAAALTAPAAAAAIARWRTS